MKKSALTLFLVAVAMFCVAISGCAAAQTFNFTLSNHSGITIDGMYVRPAGTSEKWTELELSGGLPDCSRVTFQFANKPMCGWDFYLDFFAGTDVVLASEDMCGVVAMDLTRNGNSFSLAKAYFWQVQRRNKK